MGPEKHNGRGAGGEQNVEQNSGFENFSFNRASTKYFDRPEKLTGRVADNVLRKLLESAASLKFLDKK